MRVYMMCQMLKVLIEAGLQAIDDLWWIERHVSEFAVSMFIHNTGGGARLPSLVVYGQSAAYNPLLLSGQWLTAVKPGLVWLHSP